MKRVITIRCGLAMTSLLMLGGFSRLQAQAPAKPSAAVSALPAAQPTSSGSQGTASQGAGLAGSVVPEQTAAVHHVEVAYVDGKLAIQATNASLNEILREVGQKTGMKITGGVADDRVFGSYGPSTPAVVLEALLDGTGSNILLVDDAKGGSELILTPRRGGATPPNPNAARASDSEETGPGSYVPPIRPFQAPFANGRGPGGPPSESQINTPGGEGEGGGNKTPQQIYEQLQQQQHQGNPQQ